MDGGKDYFFDGLVVTITFIDELMVTITFCDRLVVDGKDYLH